MSEFQKIIQEANFQSNSKNQFIQELLKDKVFCLLMIVSRLIGFVEGVVEAIFPDKDNSLTQNTMTTRFTYDIQTQQLVYAIVDKDGVCKYLTTSITDAIKLTQQN
jgi:hypothetical protein